MDAPQGGNACVYETGCPTAESRDWSRVNQAQDRHLAERSRGWWESRSTQVVRVPNGGSEIEPGAMVDGSRTVAIDLFCGGGGMSLGATQAGVEVVYAVERCPMAAATYRANFADTTVVVGDIRELRSLPSRSNDCHTVVFGGPPCQGFSTSNQRTRGLSNPSNWMFAEFIRVAKLWKPDWIVIENVKGIQETLKGFFLRAIENELQASGYRTSTMTLNAVDFGVPQRRSRTFVVGSKAGKEMAVGVVAEGRQVTVGEAIDDLPLLEPGDSVDELPYRCGATSEFARELRGTRESVTGNLVTRNSEEVLRRFPSVPPGGNWEDIPKRLMKNYGNVMKCHTGIYRRLRANEPSVVIGNFRKNMLIHPEQHRGLSVREAARIQCVPDGFRFCGSIGFQQQQVGNLVPPPLSRAVMRGILEA